MRVAVLGAGSWGTTLAILLSENNHDVSLWTYRAEQAALMVETRENPAFLPGIKIPKQISILTDIQEAAYKKILLSLPFPRSSFAPSSNKFHTMSFPKPLSSMWRRGSKIIPS